MEKNIVGDGTLFFMMVVRSFYEAYASLKLNVNGEIISTTTTTTTKERGSQNQIPKPQNREKFNFIKNVSKIGPNVKKMYLYV